MLTVTIPMLELEGVLSELVPQAIAISPASRTPLAKHTVKGFGDFTPFPRSFLVLVFHTYGKNYAVVNTRHAGRGKVFAKR
jgi:hypothetical protein